MPLIKVCSIRGHGTAIFNRSNSFYTGTVTMKRVNGVAIYTFDTVDNQSNTGYSYGKEERAYGHVDGWILIRPDQGVSTFNERFLRII